MTLGPTLTGELVALRPLTADDVTERYVAWLNDPEINRFLETRHERQTLDSVSAFVAAVSESADSWLFAICRRPDGAHIGNIKLGPTKPRHSLADVSLFIGERDAQGQGFGREAIALVARFAFETLALQKLSAGFYADNHASLRAFDKVGFRQEGLRRKHYLLDGKPSDIIELGLCADDWREAPRPA